MNNFVGILLVAGFLGIMWLLSEYDSTRESIDSECCHECKYKNKCKFGG